MKKKQFLITLTVIALCLSCTLFISGCKKDNKPGVESLKFDAATKTVLVGDSVTLTVTITPEDAEYKDVLTVRSSEESVASASLSDKTVTVKGLNPGKSTVTVTANSLTTSCEITVEPYTVKLDVTDTTIGINDSFLLSATVSPKEGAEPKWTSKDEKIATLVDGGFSAVVVGAGEGETYIYCTVEGRFKDSCKVTVRSAVYPEAPSLECVKIGNTVWAPVNCGYDAMNYKYGKLYQWGRKNGCGYKATDETSPYNDKGGLLQTTASGPVSASSEDAAKFYTSTKSYNNDWLTPQEDARWNSGTEASPIKIIYDPCPTGWRVPTCGELYALIGGAKITIGFSLQEYNGQIGHWFDGNNAAAPDSSGIFLPAAGYRYCSNGDAYDRGAGGDYWSSSVDGSGAGRLYFGGSGAGVSYYGSRSYGFSVRCVIE